MKNKLLMLTIFFVGIITFLQIIQPAQCSAWWEAKYKTDPGYGSNVVAALVYRGQDWNIHAFMYSVNGSVFPGPESEAWGYLWYLKESVGPNLGQNQSAGWKIFGTTTLAPRRSVYWLGGRSDSRENVANWMRYFGYEVHTYDAQGELLWLTSTSNGGASGVFFPYSWDEFEIRVLPWMRTDTASYMQHGR
jgi:hypothetical protein